MKYEVYTDGSTRNNGKADAVGAWGYVIIQNDEIMYQDSGVVEGTTNQRMELTACINACSYIQNNLIKKADNIFDNINIYTDSAYLQRCYAEEWYVRWVSNGWKNSKKEPVANKDLWLQLIDFFENSQYNFCKVKGHALNRWNNYVDNIVQTLTLKER